MIWIAESARPIWDASGVLLRYEGFVEDVSDRKALEAQQARALREATERADRDPLTGLLNHRAFHKRLEEEAARAQREGTALAVVMLDLDNFGFFNNAYGHVVGDGCCGRSRSAFGQSAGLTTRWPASAGTSSPCSSPGSADATTARSRRGCGRTWAASASGRDGHEAAIPIRVSVGRAVFPNAGTDRQEVVRQADERLLRTKTGGAVETEADEVRLLGPGQVTEFSMLDALVTAVDNKDRYTRQHSEDVMALQPDDRPRAGAGRGGAADDRRGRPAARRGQDRRPRRHPPQAWEADRRGVRGGEAAPADGGDHRLGGAGLEGTLDAVRHHHERWDGGGYPLGLRGEETPLIARLMAVADAYSAMTTDRPYRKGMEREKALAILEAGAGTQWDARCVQAFIQAEGT